MQLVFYANNNRLTAKKGETILDSLKRHGVKIPTLCNLPELNPTGACRLCVVENDETGELMPACSSPVTEGLRIHTHSPEVLKCRQTIVDLLLTNHPDDCLYCDKNRSCELQSLAEELHIRERLFSGTKKKARTDRSSQGLVFDHSKCILCGRCVKICDQIVGVSALENVFRGKNTSVETVMSKGLYYSSCIQCGQCINVCPTGALREKSGIEKITEKIYSPSEKTSVVLSAASIASIGAVFGIKKFDEVLEMLVAALKETGFSKVLTDAFASDIYFSQLAEWVLQHHQNSSKKIILTDCPAVIQWIRQKHPHCVSLLTPLRAPLQIVARMLKNDVAEGRQTVVAVMPCIARKTEAMQVHNFSKGLPDVDFVVSTNELLRLLRTRGLYMPFPKRSLIEKPYNIYSAGSMLHEFNGGFSEALIKNLQVLNGKTIVDKRLNELRSNKNLKTLTVPLHDRDYNFVALNGMQAINTYFETYVHDDTTDFIEMSACTGGCINGSSQFEIASPAMSKILLDFQGTGLLTHSVQNAIVKGMRMEQLLHRLTHINTQGDE